MKTSESQSTESAASAPWGTVEPDSDESVFPAHDEAGERETAALADDGAAGAIGSGSVPDDDGAQAEADGSDPAEPVGEARAVPVRMFDEKYNIMSDKPRLVEILASTIDREARRLKAANASFNRGTFNWPVQVAFKLALDHYYAQKALNDCRQELAECRRELETLTARVERDAEKLAELIETGLDAS